MQRQHLTTLQRWVVKIGSSLLTAEGRGLDLPAIGRWSKQLAGMKHKGCDIVLVSSGSIAEGMSRLGWTQRPRTVHRLQAAASIGQMGLVQAYESSFKSHGIGTAQILLTHDELAHRQRYLNARSTINTLLGLNVIPIINENDTVTTDEIKLGDNDTLASMVANLISADILVILTDQHGVFDKDPRQSDDAQLIPIANAEDDYLLSIAAATGGHLGSGGMRSKILAARRAARSGTTTAIASGRERDVLLRLRDGEPLGTLLTPQSEPLLARKRWLANQLKVKGQVTIDDGACEVLKRHNSSLLAVGVTAVYGAFKRGELIACISADGNEIARGLVNYNAEEVQKLKRQPSSKIADILGYSNEPELIDRDNMVLM